MENCGTYWQADIPINLKRKVYDSCILSVTTYGIETIILTQANKEQSKSNTERNRKSNAWYKHPNRVTNLELRGRTKTTDVVEDCMSEVAIGGTYCTSGNRQLDT